MKGGGRLSFEHFTPLINRQVVANGNRVLSSSPIHNLKSVHTQPHGSLQHPTLAIFLAKKSSAPSTSVTARVHTGKGQPWQRARHCKRNAPNAQSLQADKALAAQRYPCEDSDSMPATWPAVKKVTSSPLCKAELQRSNCLVA